MMIARMIAAALAMQAQAQAPAQVPAVSTGTWSIDYGTQHCALVRAPADARQPTLTLRRSPGGATELLLTGRQWRPRLPRGVNAGALVLIPGKRRLAADLVPIRGQEGLNGIGVAYIAESFMEDIAANNALVVDYRDKPLVEIALPSSRKAIEALNACNDRLLADWGVDVKRQATLRALPMPIGSPLDWFPSNAFPRSALDAGISGEVAIVLSIGTNGAVTQCRVVASAGHAGLDAQTCALAMKNARYSPAIDAEGRPTAINFLRRITWIAPVFTQMFL